MIIKYVLDNFEFIGNKNSAYNFHISTLIRSKKRNANAFGNYHIYLLLLIIISKYEAQNFFFLSYSHH